MTLIFQGRESHEGAISGTRLSMPAIRKACAVSHCLSSAIDSYLLPNLQQPAYPRRRAALLTQWPLRPAPVKIRAAADVMKTSKGVCMALASAV